jgi:hypothetical protein
MAVNTAYLSVNTSAQSNINSAYISTGLAGFPSTVSVANSLFANTVTVRGAQTFTGAATFSGAGSFASNLSVGGTLAVGGGTAVAKISTATVSLATSVVSGSSSLDQAFAFSGAAVNDAVVLGLPASGLSAHLVATGFVSSADTVSIRLSNVSTANIVNAAGNIVRVTLIEY